MDGGGLRSTVTVLGRSESCGNDETAFTGDLDFNSFRVDFDLALDLELSWTSSTSDIDLALFSSTWDWLENSHERQAGGGEALSWYASSEASYVLRVACWTGAPTDWTLTITPTSD